MSFTWNCSKFVLLKWQIVLLVFCSVEFIWSYLLSAGDAYHSAHSAPIARWPTSWNSPRRNLGWLPLQSLYNRRSGIVSSEQLSNYLIAPVRTRHTVEYRKVPILSKPPKPQTILVETSALPLTILFRSASSELNILQQHIQTEGQVKNSKSEDEPYRLFHEVIKPIIQEVHEVIMPYRKVTQEIQPLQEDIQTIVARGIDAPQKNARYEGVDYPNYPNPIENSSKPSIERESLSDEALNPPPTVTDRQTAETS